jgi:hypothetical protein
VWRRLITLQRDHDVNYSLCRQFIYFLLTTFQELGLIPSSHYTEFHRITLVTVNNACFAGQLNNVSHSMALNIHSMYIQGDSGAKINILGGDSIGHCEEKVSMNICLILNGYRNRAL